MTLTQVMGDRQHRAWVGPPDYYDRLGALQFVVLLLLGMREDDSLLDLGCGSLRGGRFSLLYLNSGNYFGIEPAHWCLDEGIAAEIGHELIALKRPTFSFNDDFGAQHFGRQFDYIMAAGIFMHTCPRQIRQCFDAMGQVLAKDGVFVGAFLAGDTDSHATDWTYPDIQRYTPATLMRIAQECGLRVTFVEAPHTLDHQWFIATRRHSTRTIAPRLDLSIFSWPEYLADQLRRRGGIPQPYEYYLKRELTSRLSAEDNSVVPQARL